ncbi:MAG: low specificity L-threonine aldolase [Clostridia bacterium]|nr:low specificity L-threonine aldolase [Clostridia bacterium]
MISFASDYVAGAHPTVLAKLIETNREPMGGYGDDPYSVSAKEKIKQSFSCPDADVVLLTGGTQTNQVAISTYLQSYEGVIAARTGHISIHEAGAIEYTGHKVLEFDGENGKLPFSAVESYLRAFYADPTREHQVRPGLIYLSFPTEYGTLYSKAELKAFHELCAKYEMKLFLDGARLAYGLSSPQNDVLPDELQSLCDFFTVGGTKIGALCGEAIVYPHHSIPPHMLSQVKQRGALLAKGRLVGVQFDALFTDGLYFEIGRHGIEMAERIKQLFLDRGYKLFMDSPTNQQFIILENKKMEELSKEVDFVWWDFYDETHTVVRFASGWSTDEEAIALLERIL